MELIRQVVVLDASDVATESAFWAGLLDGRVLDEDDAFHCVVDSSDRWVIGVQHAPNHVPPSWPDGSPQQLHLDLHVVDFPAAHAQAMALGATVLRAAADPGAEQGHQVYADPAGHPFCLGWGQPDDAAVRRYVASVFGSDAEQRS